MLSAALGDGEGRHGLVLLAVCLYKGICVAPHFEKIVDCKCTDADEELRTIPLRRYAIVLPQMVIRAKIDMTANPETLTGGERSCWTTSGPNTVAGDLVESRQAQRNTVLNL